MPGSWRAKALAQLNIGCDISTWAHFGLLAGLAWLAYARPLALPLPHVVLVTFGLALVSEGLQFLAQDRYPSWTDVCIDMAGTLFGVAAVAAGRFAQMWWARIS